MAITGDNQWEWRSFKVGDGTNYGVIQWDPGHLRVRSNPANRVGSHGAILPRSDLLPGRELMLQLRVRGTTRANLQDRLDALDAATLPVSTGDDTLQFQILGETRRVYCRPRPARWLWTMPSNVNLWVANVAVEFYAQDPRVYTDTETVTVLS